jgi:hypothetical protein
MTSKSLLAEARQNFHTKLLSSVLSVDDNGVPSNADKHNRASVHIAKFIVDRIGDVGISERLSGQSSGNQFEDICAKYVEATFLKLSNIRPGKWKVTQVGQRDSLAIAHYEQYAHLIALDEAAQRNRTLAASLGNDYSISPDVIVTRTPEEDAYLNSPIEIVDPHVANLASIRAVNKSLPFLHASISCKWTIRSDRAQNARSEALNLIRNRKGRLPHIVIVTGEPTPSRLSSLALGTGDIDCVYHIALPELRDAVNNLGQSEAEDLLAIMVEGKRLKDISDLPLDLAV